MRYCNLSGGSYCRLSYHLDMPGKKTKVGTEIIMEPYDPIEET